MSAPLVLVRLVASGECVEVDARTPIVLHRDVFPDEREATIYAPLTACLTRTSARTWRKVFPSCPAYVLDADAFAPELGHAWHLAEFPDAATPASAPTLPVLPSVPDGSGEWVSFGEVEFLGEEGGS